MKSLKLILPKLCLVTMSIWAIGCSEKFQYETYRWSREAATSPVPSSLESKILGKKPTNFEMAQSRLIFETQKIQGVEVEGSYYKELRTPETVFKSFHWIVDVPFSLRAKIFFFQIRKLFVQNEFLRQNKEYREYSAFDEPRLILRDRELLWKLTFETREGRLLGVYWQAQKGIVEKVELGSGYQSPIASLFPEGPLKSQIQKVPLPELQGRKVLSTPKVQVVTQSDGAVYSEDSEFIYSPEDPRFEQVQVYYYLSRMIQWCENELGFRIPFMLEAETNVGFPDRTNTAFYYQRKIRLGEGDGRVFAKMALDPSVVTHEGFHSLIDSVARLPFQGEGGSVNEAFADFFTAILLDNPRMGEFSYKKAPFKRTIENELKRQDVKGTLYGDSGVVSGLLWELAEKLGPETGMQLAWETLLRLNPRTQIADVGLELREVISQISAPGVKAQASEIMNRRGWP